MFPYIELITSCDLLTIFLPCHRDRWDFIEENKEPQLSKLIPSQRDIHKLFYSVVKLTPSIPQNINLNDLLASGYFSSFACTISSTLLIVYQIYNSISNQDNHSNKRFVHIHSGCPYSISCSMCPHINDSGNCKCCFGHLQRRCHCFIVCSAILWG